MGRHYLQHLRAFIGEDLDADGLLAQAAVRRSPRLLQRRNWPRLPRAACADGLRRRRLRALTAPLVQAGELSRAAASSTPELHRSIARRRAAPRRAWRATRPARRQGEPAACAAAPRAAARVRASAAARHARAQPARSSPRCFATPSSSTWCRRRNRRRRGAASSTRTCRGGDRRATVRELLEAPAAFDAPTQCCLARRVPRQPRHARRARQRGAAVTLMRARSTSRRTGSTRGSPRSRPSGWRAARGGGRGPARRRLRLGREPAAGAAADAGADAAGRRARAARCRGPTTRGFIHAPSLDAGRRPRRCCATPISATAASRSRTGRSRSTCRRAACALARWLLDGVRAGPAARRAARLPIRAPAARAASSTRSSPPSASIAPLVAGKREPTDAADRGTSPPTTWSTACACASGWRRHDVREPARRAPAIRVARELDASARRSMRSPTR